MSHDVGVNHEMWGEFIGLIYMGKFRHVEQCCDFSLNMFYFLKKEYGYKKERKGKGGIKLLHLEH